MKKRICVVMVLIVLFSFSINTYAADYFENEKQNADMISFETIQRLFPDIPIREDGFVDGYESDFLSVNSLDEEKLDEILSQPKKSCNAEYNGGICTLNIYDNGMYDVVGFEKIDTIAVRNPGAEVYGSRYRSYYKFSFTGFFYTYTIYSSGNYSQFHNLSYTQSLPDADPYWDFVAGSTGYIRQTQTASLPAEVYGVGYFSYMGGASTGVKLITDVSYGNIGVSLQVP